MSKGRKITLAIFTAWPFLYMILFMCTVLGMMISDFSGSSEPPVVMMIIFPLHLLTMLEIFILLAIYIVHLFRTGRISQDKKALWAVVLFLGNMFAMPVYWYLYIWKEPKEPAPEQESENHDKVKTSHSDNARGYKYTAEQAYKLSVMPLGIFLIIGGVFAGLAGAVFPADHIFVGAVQSEAVKRVAMVATGLFCLAVGYGLIRKNRAAWYTLLLMPWISFAAMPLTEAVNTADYPVTAIFAVIFSVVMSVGLYYVTKPVFRAQDATCRTETVNRGTAKWLLALGRWVVLATHIWICLFLIGIVAGAVYLTGTDRTSFQPPEPWNSLVFYAVFIPHITVTISWGLFCLVFLVLYRRILGGGVIRQIVTLMAVAIPFWGLGYYNRVTKKLIETSLEEVR